jgi:hypothetical protein
VAGNGNHDMVKVLRHSQKKWRETGLPHLSPRRHSLTLPLVERRKPGISFAHNHSGKIAPITLGRKLGQVSAGLGGFVPQNDTLFQITCNAR